MKNIYLYLAGLGALGVAFWQRETIAEIPSAIMGKLTRSEFIKQFAPLVIMVSKGTGLFPSVFLAQAILESNNGNSSLSKEAKNYFGIKADTSWTGAYVLKPTWEDTTAGPVKIDAKFRAYPDILSGFQDRVKFLQKFSRYKPVFAASSPEGQAKALLTAGYATDREYANKLISLINSNNLKQFDA